MTYSDEDLKDYPDWKKKLSKSKYGFSFGISEKKLLPNYLADIDERLRDLEHKANPTAKKIISTRSQQMLLLHELGFLDKLNEFNISNKKKAKLLSTLLNASADNIEGDLSEINKKDSKLKTSSNYKMLVDTYKLSGLKELEQKADKQLDEIERLENKN